MSDIIIKHPIFNNAQELEEICRPLQSLGINYFSHVRIDKEDNFMGIGNGPEFSENYFKKKYYNADIHLEKSNRFGKYIIWDDICRYGKSDEMYRDGLEFGVNHVFTIVGEKNENGSNYYHFASNAPSNTINQTYLSNLDLLELFILHFKENLKQSRELSSVYDLKFNIDKEQAGYFIKDENNLVAHQNQRLEFIRSLEALSSPIFSASHIGCLPPQQAKCLRLLLEGRSAKQIAQELGLSNRTVEHYLQTIRKKLGCRNQIELVNKINNK